MLTWRACKIIVATNKGEVGHVDEPCQIIESVIKFMVADGACIVFHAVHQFHLHLAVLQIVISRPLAEVATVKQQEFGVLLA